MNERYPDIEIYLKDPAPEAVLSWLEENFGGVTSEQRGNNTHFHLGNTEALLVPNAVKGRYASLWFKTNTTPWHDDEACARSAHATMGVEVRCSLSAADPDDDGPGEWLRLTGDGESQVRWQT